jgi:hypothetical protein
MSSRWTDRLRYALPFRLALWYGVLFVASSVALVGLTYLLLARSLGYECFSTDLSDVYDKAGLLEKTAAAMSFPGWFGQNWDAWFDCLTDFGWQPQATGYVLIMRHALALKQAAPEAFDTALAILDDAA